MVRFGHGTQQVGLVHLLLGVSADTDWVYSLSVVSSSLALRYGL